ncbi:hypothetical protein HYALB_00010698 [Hymenoscyphus albidus]|uniref:Uncharacterized protein n=1 Tax=Hymenoscyphus albidus TaxID=595503 RepID=A0A9N9M2I0_9HELO|nr:hypothetical protein HYALB_00010698 [Hymenoscyphus albidus]
MTDHTWRCLAAKSPASCPLYKGARMKPPFDRFETAFKKGQSSFVQDFLAMLHVARSHNA